MGNDPDTAPARQPSGRGWRRRKPWPGPIVCAIAGVFAALLVAVRTTPWVGDHAVNNIMTLIFGFDILLVFAVWFFFFSSYRRRTRRRAFGLLCVVLVLAVALLRLDRVSGDMLPKFRLFWVAERSAPAPQKAAGEADLTTTTELDFPQFLGPGRDLHYSPVQLARSWTDAPPKLIWRQAIGAGWSGFSVVNGYAVTMEQHGQQENVTCYEAATGKRVWFHGVTARHDTTLGGLGPRSTPTITDGKVVALGATGILRCLDGDSGEPLWQVDLLEQFDVTPEQESQQVSWGRAASPLVVDQQVVVPAGGPAGGTLRSLAAFQLDTGELLWTAGDDQISYSSPTVATLAGVRQILSVNEATVSGHQVEDGKMLWSLSWKGSSSSQANTSQPMAIGPQSLLVSRGYFQGAGRIEVSMADGEFAAEFAWQNSAVLRTKLTSAVVRDGYAYGLNDGILECVDLSDGSRQWKFKRLYHGQLLMVDDLLLALSERGDLYLLEASPAAPTQLGLLEDALSGACWNNLCLFGRLLLIRSGREAACYELPGEG